MVTDIPISKIMTKREKLVCLNIPGNRDLLLDTIQKTGLNVYPVLKEDSDTLVGVVSRSDLFKNPSETQLSLLMKRDVITLRSSDTIIKAAKIFAREVFQRIPITDENGQLEGLISRTDIVRMVVNPAKLQADVKDYFNTNVTTIWEETPITVAARVMRLSHQKGIPVINEAEMVGIVSQNDFLKVVQILDTQSKSLTGHGAENDSSSWDSESVLIIGAKTLTLPRDLMVREIMERNVEICYQDSTISEVCRKMVTKKIDQLPVVDVGGEITGIINQKDLIRAYIDFYNANPP
ncbi:MAG: CBS domain-containing protein [Candidatus Heimdallarchaeota archaeon]